MEGVSAGGKLVSPLYIDEGGAHLMGNHDYKDRDDASFGLSNTGWTNNEFEYNNPTRWWLFTQQVTTCLHEDLELSYSSCLFQVCESVLLSEIYL